MPLGLGFWYDRRHCRYHRIFEHATDAIQHPRRFRSQAVAHLNPTQDREIIVRHVTAQGFIRVRYWRANLGWEFYDSPQTALEVLRRFIRKHEAGPVVEANISDFKSGISILVSASAVMASKSTTNLGLIKSRRPK